MSEQATRTSENIGMHGTPGQPIYHTHFTPPENEKVQLKISFTVGKISGTLGVIIQV
jgi:hypothetical protein